MALLTPDWVAAGWDYNLATETITLLPKVADGAPPGPAVTVTDVKRRAEGRTVEDHLAGREVTFHLWVAKLQGATPKRGDVIRDAAGLDWVVRSVWLESLGERYRCVCRRNA